MFFPPQKIHKQMNENEENNSISKRNFVTMQFRGLKTDQFVKKLKSCGEPVQVILMLRKLRLCFAIIKKTCGKAVE